MRYYKSSSDVTFFSGHTDRVIWAFSRRPQIILVIVGVLSCSHVACLGQFLYTTDVVEGLFHITLLALLWEFVIIPIMHKYLVDGYFLR